MPISYNVKEVAAIHADATRLERGRCLGIVHRARAAIAAYSDRDGAVKAYADGWLSAVEAEIEDNPERE